jgi:hypothetical protein
MRVRDIHDDQQPEAWAGLAVVVDAPAKSRLRVEYASPGLLRITYDDRPLMWCRWHGGFEGFSWIREREVPHLLPPVVTCFVSLLDSFLLLDGHDRLHAAILEGVAPPMMALSSVHALPVQVDEAEQARLYNQLEERFGGAGPLEPGTTRSLEWTFRAKFPPHTHAVSRTRAWPIRGGCETWRAEVEARLRSATAVGTDCRLSVTE